MPENRLTWVSLFMALRYTERFDLTFQLRKDRLHIRRDRLTSGNQPVHHIKEGFALLFFFRGLLSKRVTS